MSRRFALIFIASAFVFIPIYAILMTSGEVFELAFRGKLVEGVVLTSTYEMREHRCGRLGTLNCKTNQPVSLVKYNNIERRFDMDTLLPIGQTIPMIVVPKNPGNAATGEWVDRSPPISSLDVVWHQLKELLLMAFGASILLIIGIFFCPKSWYES